MTMLLRIAERVINRPLLVHPDKLPLILGVLEGRIPVGDVSDLRRQAEDNIDAMPDAARAIMRGPSPGASRFVGTVEDQDPETGARKLLPYRRTPDGIAVITVTGSLINRGAWVGSNSGETSYEGIKHQVATAAADPRARAILMDIESPGGEAVGAFEAASAIRAAAAKKPVTAIINGMAASAAYALASGATKIVTTPTGIAGSIGVVMMHADYSRFLDRKGITPTLIFAGAHKVDGNPLQPLPNNVRSDLQKEVDQFYEMFVQTVAAGRRGLSPDAIRSTEARTFIGEDAVAAGLADSVSTFEEVMAEISRGSHGRNDPSTPKGTIMSDSKQGAPVAAENATITKEVHEAAITAARAEGKAEGMNQGAEAERNRILGIEKAGANMGHDDLVAKLKADGKTTPEQAAMAILEAESQKRAAQLKGIKAVEDKTGRVQASPQSGTDTPAAEQQQASNPDGWRAEYDAKTPAGEKLRAEFATKEDYVAFKANESKVHILGKRTAA